MDTFTGKLAVVTGGGTGMGRELTRQLAEANVNVDLAYTTFTGGRIVIATYDMESARAVLP